jgi:hypothetical protein
MATTKSERESAYAVLRKKYEEWEKMSDEELHNALTEVLVFCLCPTWKNRENTIKWLVLKFVERNMCR